jgi:hypothetical protein
MNFKSLLLSISLLLLANIAFAQRSSFLSSDFVSETGTLNSDNIPVDFYPYSISGDITVKGMNPFGYGKESTLDTQVNVLNDYPITEGTFIQDWLVSKWDDARWQEEFEMLKEAGNKYLVFASALHTDINDVPKAIYATSMDNVKSKYSTDLIDICLRNAREAGFKVFIGLNFHDRWWQPSYSPEWLHEQMEIGNRVADELVSLYKNKYDSTFYGWYWSWEIDNLNYKTQQRQNMLINALNININHLNEITPDMPFLFCPFVNYRIGDSHENRDMWKYILPQVHFREGDIFGPQDCIGAGGLELSMLGEWFGLMSEVVDSIPGLQFWSDAETFDQRFWTAGTLDRFVEQLQIVEPYVDKIISFAYSHYYSPFLKKKNFHEGYVEYYQTGSLPDTGSPKPVVDLTAEKNENGEIVLTWNEPGNIENIVGYFIYRNGNLIGDIQYNNNNWCETIFTDTDIQINANVVYDVYSYTITSVKSPKRSITY